MKRILFLVLFLVFVSSNSLLWADLILDGPYELEEGLDRYQQITSRPVFHRGKDNPLEENFFGQCTWFCYAVTKDRISARNAYQWYDDAQKINPNMVGNTPKIGAICVWRAEYSGGYGHVAKVTSICENGDFEIWEANYISSKITHRYISDYSQIRGFIYPASEAILFSIQKVYPENNSQILNNSKIAVRFSNAINPDCLKQPDRYFKIRLDNKELNSDSVNIKAYNDRAVVIIPENNQWQGQNLEINISSEFQDVFGQNLASQINKLIYRIEKKPTSLVSTGPTAIVDDYTSKRYIEVLRLAFISDLETTDKYLFFYVGKILYKFDYDGKLRETNRYIDKKRNLYLSEGYSVRFGKSKNYLIGEIIQNNQRKNVIIIFTNSNDLKIFTVPNNYGDNRNVLQYCKSALDKNDNLLLMQNRFCHEQKIQKINSNGTIVAKLVNSQLDSRLQFVSLDTAPDGKVYILANCNPPGVIEKEYQLIIVADQNLNIIRKIKIVIQKPQQPRIQALAVDCQNALYLAYLNYWKKYRINEKSFKLIGKWNSKLSRIENIKVNEKQEVIVSDKMRLEIFTKK